MAAVMESLLIEEQAYDPRHLNSPKALIQPPGSGHSPRRRAGSSVESGKLPREFDDCDPVQACCEPGSGDDASVIDEYRLAGSADSDYEGVADELDVVWDGADLDRHRSSDREADNDCSAVIGDPDCPIGGHREVMGLSDTGRRLNGGPIGGVEDVEDVGVPVGEPDEAALVDDEVVGRAAGWDEFNVGASDTGEFRAADEGDPYRIVSEGKVVRLGRKFNGGKDTERLRVDRE